MKNLKWILVVVCLFAAAVSFNGLASKTYHLSWTASPSADVAGYRLFRRAEGDSYEYNDPIWEGIELQSPQLDDSALADGTYYYVCRAFDEAGNESIDSNEAGPQKVDNTPPEPPVGCTYSEP